MSPAEYRIKVFQLEQKIETLKRIHCPLVAARFQRQLDALRKEYETNQKS